MANLKPLLFLALFLVALLGALTNLIHLKDHFHFLSVVRFLGYGFLLVYSLLMFRLTGYNTFPSTQEDKSNED